MRLATFVLLLSGMLSATLSYSQNYRQPFIFGLQGMVHKSTISNLETTIIPETFFNNYTASSEAVTNMGGGLFMNFRYENEEGSSHIGGQLEAGFAQQGGLMKFNNTEKDFHYDMAFKYTYMNVGLLCKLYPINMDNNGAGGLNVGLGAQVNFPVKPDNIRYTSGGPGYEPAFGSDLEQQQQLRNVLKQRTTASLIYSISWELPSKLPFILDFRYVQGIDDAIETRPNSYNFVENYNQNTLLQLRLSLYFQQKMDN